MDIRLMHIDFHALSQQKLGNDYTHLEHETVDDFINLEIANFIRIKTNNKAVQDGQSNSTTEMYYEGLETLIRSVKISQLPRYLYNGIGKVADLNAIGRATGIRFSASGSLKSGSLYRILSYTTGDDFTAVGGTNEVGAVFSANAEATFQPSDRSVGFVIRTPEGTYIADASALKAGVAYTLLEGNVTYTLASIGVNSITVDGVVKKPNDNIIADLLIDKGSTFVVNEDIVPGAWINSSVLENLDVGDTFYKFISSSSVVDFGTPTTTATMLSKNRLIMARDIETHLNNSRGTVTSAPLSHIEGEKLIVYDNISDKRVPIHEKFTIVEVVVRYYKKPNTVSLLRGIDCDLSEIDHDLIVRNAVELASAASVAQNFNTLSNQNQKDKVIN